MKKILLTAVIMLFVNFGYSNTLEKKPILERVEIKKEASVLVIKRNDQCASLASALMESIEAEAPGGCMTSAEYNAQWYNIYNQCIK